MMTKASTLSDAARRRGLIVILADTFFMWGGFFMVVPLISVHYVDGLGWSAASIGLVLAMRQLTQQGLTLPGGMLADRVGTKCGDNTRDCSFDVVADDILDVRAQQQHDQCDTAHDGYREQQLLRPFGNELHGDERPVRGGDKGPALE